MKSPDFLARPARPKTYFFGSFYARRDPVRNVSTVGIHFGRLLLVSGLSLGLIYGLAATLGYVWLNRIRRVEQITIVDVALLRWKQVRRGIAAQQFAQAKAALDAREYQKAFLSYNSALRNDPDNVPIRLSAAGFFLGAGLSDVAITLLEEGVTRVPDNHELLQRTFELLAMAGRHERALKLLHGQLATKLSGPNGLLLRRYEVLATLNTAGAKAAKALLEANADLRRDPDAAMVVAQVQWENKDRLEAISTLTDYVKAVPDSMAGYAQLASFQEAAGMLEDARETARRAREKFPQEVSIRILFVNTLAPGQLGQQRRWEDEVVSFLKDFRDRPEALSALADLAGRRGWVDLARVLYEEGLGRQADARMLALYYSDALMRTDRLAEARAVLDEVEDQAQGENAFCLLLWQRQVVAAAAAGDHDDARDKARRLAVALQHDPEKLEICRRRFVQLGVPEAVSELTITTQKTAPTAVKKS